MLRRGPVCGMILAFVVFCNAAVAGGQVPAHTSTVTITVVDEDGLPISGAQITLFEPGRGPVHLQTDYAGRCAYPLENKLPYSASGAEAWLLPGLRKSDRRLIVRPSK